nr:Arm DNA-binding domain-containing protein [Roseobacter ponti]
MSVKSALPGKHEDGLGLRLFKRADGGGTWDFRYSLHGRRREMGLGGISSVSPKLARELAAEHRATVALGIDPIKNRERERRAALSSRNLLREIAEDAFESRKADLKHDGKAGRWFSPLALHILPRLGERAGRDILSRMAQIDIVPSVRFSCSSE